MPELQTQGTKVSIPVRDVTLMLILLVLVWAKIDGWG